MQFRACSFDEFSGSMALVSAESIDKHEVSGHQHGHEAGFHEGLEDLFVDPPLSAHHGFQARQSQGTDDGMDPTPVVRSFSHGPKVSCRAPIFSTQSFVGAGFVDEDESLGLRGCDQLQEGLSLGEDDLSFAFGSSKRFFCGRFGV